MKKVLLSLFILPILCFSQTPLPKDWDQEREANSLRIAFYNIENLFDTIDNPNTKDEDFTPQSEKEWNSYKYNHKINSLSKVIIALGGWEAIDALGIAEVEDSICLVDLINKSFKDSKDYKYVHYNSEDRRGIDVAFIYNSKKIEILDSRPIKVPIKGDEDFKTRDILYAKALINNQHVHFYVNHWSSRLGGRSASEYKRMAASNALKTHCDSIFKEDKKANILIMGDFNDEARNESLINLTSSSPLNNMMLKKASNFGTHKYGGYWSYLDQFIVSNALKKRTDKNGAVVFWQDWMLKEETKSPSVYPKRTWRGPFYGNGYSDHLPIYIDLTF